MSAVHSRSLHAVLVNLTRTGISGFLPIGRTRDRDAWVPDRTDCEESLVLARADGHNGAGGNPGLVVMAARSGGRVGSGTGILPGYHPTARTDPFGGGGHSRMSWYLTIRSDADYSRFTATTPLGEFLAAMPELRQVGPAAFESARGEPWVSVVLAACSPAGSYACDGPPPHRVNLVELVCSESGDRAWYDALAGRIAGFLGWSAFEDHEARRVWPPAEPRHV